MPECRDADRACFLWRPVRVNGVEADGDRVQQPGRVVLDAAVPSQPRRALHLVRATGDRAAAPVVERGAYRRGPDVERDDHS